MVYLTEHHTYALYQAIVTQIKKHPNLSETILASEIEELCIIRENMMREYAFLCATSHQFPLDLKKWSFSFIESLKEELYFLNYVIFRINIMSIYCM
jgi:hypothetical protein